MKEGKANIVRSSIERIECEEEAKNACPVSAISLIK
jgi:ferredoxin